MQLFVKNGIVIAMHDDGQAVPASAYGDGVTIQALAAGEASPKLLDPAPEADLTSYAASARYAKETGGITVNGMSVATDRGSQALITGAWATMQINPKATIQWKAADGLFVSLDAAAITGLATAVTGHVQACFAAEATVGQGITAGTVKTPADVDKAFAAVTA